MPTVDDLKTVAAIITILAFVTVFKLAMDYLDPNAPELRTIEKKKKQFTRQQHISELEHDLGLVPCTYERCRDCVRAREVASLYGKP